MSPYQAITHAANCPGFKRVGVAARPSKPDFRGEAAAGKPQPYYRVGRGERDIHPIVGVEYPTTVVFRDKQDEDRNLGVVHDTCQEQRESSIRPALDCSITSAQTKTTS